MGKKSKEGLGRALIKDRFGATRGKRKVDNNSMLHTTEINDGYDWGRLNLQSVTAESSLQEFLSTAELAGKEFTAEKLNLSVAYSAPVLVSKITAKECNKIALAIPRRPVWVEGVSSSEQTLKEKEAFLEWKRNLVNLQNKDGAALTPYERNIELWRQLWRTLEKSDLLLILLDARNPLLFRCQDLEKAAEENNAQCVLLLNKADLIGEIERKLWARYFDKMGIRIAFFSAAADSNSKDINKTSGHSKEGDESDEGYDASDSDNEITDENDSRSTDDENTLQQIHKTNKVHKDTSNVDDVENSIGTGQFDIGTETNRCFNIISKEVVENKENEIESSNSDKVIEESPTKLGTSSSDLNVDSIESERINSLSQSNKDLSTTEAIKSSKVNILSEEHIDVTYTSNNAEDGLNTIKLGSSSGELYDELNPKLGGLSIAEDNSILLKNIKCRVTFEDDLKLEKDKTYKEQSESNSITSEEKHDFNVEEREEENSMRNSHLILDRIALIQMLKMITISEMKNPPRLTVGLIGYPNVGKSSTVNTLMQTKKVSVSAMPGHTRHVQSLVLDDLLLLDCPGLVLPTYALPADLLLTAVLPIDQMTSYELAIQRLIDLVGKEELKNRYGLLLPDQSGPFLPQHLLSAHAFNRGFMTAAGRPDESRSARLLLKQASNGRLKWAQLPPGTSKVLQKKFIVDTKQTRKPTPLEKRLVQGWNSAAADIDCHFFTNNKPTAHIKGIPAPGISGVSVQSVETSSEKPWKKHNKHANKNKKEKLRKTYWQLDKH